MRSASDECVWLYHFACSVPFLFDFTVTSANPVKPVPLLIDNEPSISTACHPKITAQTKHIQLRHFRIRDAQGDDGEPTRVQCLWCPTKFNVADHFTKIPGKAEFPRLAQFLVDVPATEVRAAAQMPTVLPDKTPAEQLYLDIYGTHQILNDEWAVHDECDYDFYTDIT